MKVLVLGSGVIGVSAAYQLAIAGHEVVVVDRQPAPALETSFANAGEVSPGYSAPWAGPGVPLQAIKWLLMRRRPLVIRANLDLELLRWGLAMVRNCTAARHEINKARMMRWLSTAAIAWVPCEPAWHHLRRTHARHAAAVSHPQAVRWQRR
jgi:D-amino-acid dehydrogenase